MKKRILLTLTITFVVVFLLALSVSAMEGSGTEDDPYVVTTAEEFVSIQSGLGAYYRLDNDISVSSTTGAIVEGPFTGVFDGNGHTITVTIEASTSSNSDTLDGVFGQVTGTVKNLIVKGSVTGSNKVAGIVGKLYENGRIENCVNYASVYGRKNVAGITGVLFNNATVVSCVNYGDISGKSISNGVDLGGIIGCAWYTSSASALATNCRNLGTINGEGNNCGGIIGYSYAGEIKGCINAGANTSTGYSGSLIGATSSGYTHKITSCLSVADASIIGDKKGNVTITENPIESTGVAIYLGSGSGIRGEFHVNTALLEAVFATYGEVEIEYGAVVSTKEVVEALEGDLLSEEAQATKKVVFAPAMKGGEELYSYADASRGEGYHSYRFAITGFADTKQSYNLEFVILGYIKATYANGSTELYCLNTVKSPELASNAQGTPYNSVNIVRVAEVTIADGDFADNQEALDVLNHIVDLKEYSNKIDIDGNISYGHVNATFTSHTTGQGTVVFEINDTSNVELESYVNDLNASGYELVSQNKIGENVFYLYKKDEMLINIAYYSSTNEVNISKDTSTVLPSNLSVPVYETKNTSTITQIKLADDVSIKEGMSYVIHLADGTFLIIDGGWCYDDYLEADKLYDTLAQLAGEGNEIVIAGWIFTHCHGDHIGTFNFFVEKYHNSVTISQLLYNFPSEEEIASSSSSYMLDSSKQRYTYFKEMIATYLTDTEIVKIHSGYKFYYANAEIEILQTFEDIYPSAVSSYDFNSTSTLFTVKIEGQRMMFLGDVSSVGATRLTSMYGSALKSDFMQVAHHGLNYDSAIKALYQAIDAPYILYPACEEWYRSNITGNANAYLETSTTVKQIFVSGLDTVEIYLPYDGALFDGARVPNTTSNDEAQRPSQSIEVPDAYFDLDLSGNTPTDASGNATVTVVNGAIKETTVTHNGQELNGLAYTNGDNGTYYMSVKFNDITTEEQMKSFVMNGTTFEFFMKLDRLPGATVGLITSCNGGGVTLYLRRQAGGQINFQMGSTAKNNQSDSDKYSSVADMGGTSPVVAAGELLHIVGSYDRSTNMMKLYLNGLLLCEADYGSGEYRLGSGDDTVIGIGYNPQYSGECISSYTDYELYEARIYDKALTDEQVAQQYWNCIDNLFTEATNE